MEFFPNNLIIIKRLFQIILKIKKKFKFLSLSKNSFQINSFRKKTTLHHLPMP